MAIERPRERPRASPHSPHLDGLRTVLVAWVIAGHALLGYSAVGGWPYDEIHEVVFAPAVELALVAVIGPSGLFVIGVLFFVSGLLTERSLRRRGRAEYVRSRAVRLGLPWLASALLLWPTSLWLAYRAAGRPVSWWWVLTQRDPPLDSGSLWFALVLLLYSVGFALLPARTRATTSLTVRHLVAVAAAIAIVAFAVRLVLPARSGQIGDLHLWQWPECLGMFVLGILAARRGWDRHVPARLARICGASVLTALALLPVLARAAGVRDVSRDVGPYLGGWHWQALLVAVVEAVLTVGGAVWLVGWAERRRGGAGPSAVRWAPGAYLAFVIQGPVLLGVATALRPLPAPAELKAPVVAAASVVLCFWLGRRLPALLPKPGHRADHRGTATRPAVREDAPVSGPGRNRTVDLGLGPRIHYVDHQGPPGGHVLVLVHGLGGSHLNWDLLAPRLTGRARVLAVDLPGFGLSRPTGRPATVARNVAVLERFVLRVAGGQAILVGNSIGGMMSILLAARSPVLVRGLALVAPVLARPDPAGAPWRTVRAVPAAVPVLGELLTRWHRRRVGAAGVVRETLELGGVDPAALPAGTVDRAVDLVTRREDVAGADRALLTAARSVGWALARAGRYRAEIDAVTAPVLLVQGDRDRLAPVETARAAARSHPGWRYVELTGVGHLPQLQVPDVLAYLLLDWLDQRVLRPTLPAHPLHASTVPPEPGGRDRSTP